MEEYSIGELGRATATKIPTIRYYERIGLLPEPLRTRGNQRRYGDTDIDRLAFIRHARAFGFSLTMVRELLSLSDDPSHACSDVDRIARAHLHSVEQRIRTLGLLKAELERMIQQCKGGTVSECRIIDALANHAPNSDNRPRLGNS
jgi:DNA-binding transcriptional MerR regulator